MPRKTKAPKSLVMNRKYMAKVIFTTRFDRNINQEELGRMARTSQATVSRAERADPKVTLDAMARIAGALGMKVRVELVEA